MTTGLDATTGTGPEAVIGIVREIETEIATVTVTEIATGHVEAVVDLPRDIREMRETNSTMQMQDLARRTDELLTWME